MAHYNSEAKLLNEVPFDAIRVRIVCWFAVVKTPKLCWITTFEWPSTQKLCETKKTFPQNSVLIQLPKTLVCSSGISKAVCSHVLNSPPITKTQKLGFHQSTRLKEGRERRSGKEGRKRKRYLSLAEGSLNKKGNWFLCVRRKA